MGHAWVTEDNVISMYKGVNLLCQFVQIVYVVEIKLAVTDNCLGSEKKPYMKRRKLGMPKGTRCQFQMHHHKEQQKAQ